MFENNRGTDWNFPSWEQEQEIKRMAEIQARAFQETAQKSAQQAAEAARKAARNNGTGMNYIAQYVQKAVKAAPDYEEKREATLHKAQELDAKGGTFNNAFAAIIRAICK